MSRSFEILRQLSISLAHFDQAPCAYKPSARSPPRFSPCRLAAAGSRSAALLGVLRQVMGPGLCAAAESVPRRIRFHAANTTKTIATQPRTATRAAAWRSQVLKANEHDIESIKKAKLIAPAQVGTGKGKETFRTSPNRSSNHLLPQPAQQRQSISRWRLAAAGSRSAALLGVLRHRETAPGAGSYLAGGKRAARSELQRGGEAGGPARRLLRLRFQRTCVGRSFGCLPQQWRGISS